MPKRTRKSGKAQTSIKELIVVAAVNSIDEARDYEMLLRSTSSQSLQSDTLGVNRRSMRKLMLIPLILLLALTAHWLLFQGEVRVPGVMPCPVESCGVRWFERRGGVIILIGQALHL